MDRDVVEFFESWLSLITLDFTLKLSAKADEYMRNEGESGLYDYLFINDSKSNGAAFKLRSELLEKYNRIIEKKVDNK